MIKQMSGIAVAAMAVGLIGLTGAPANATPIGPDNCTNNSCNGGIYTLTSDGVDLNPDSALETFLFTFTVSNTANIITTLGGGTYYIDAVAIKVTNTNLMTSTFAVSLDDAPDQNGDQGHPEVWNPQLGGLNNGGCNGSGGGFTCADFIASMTNGVGAKLTDDNDMSWVFRVTAPVGDFFAIEDPNVASVKARFIQVLSDGSIDRVGSILSEPITIQNEVPEPATLGVLGVGLIGLGFAARRCRKAA